MSQDKLLFASVELNLNSWLKVLELLSCICLKTSAAVKSKSPIWFLSPLL